MADTTYRICVVKDTENDGTAYLDRGAEQQVQHMTLDEFVELNGKKRARALFNRELNRVSGPAEDRLPPLVPDDGCLRCPNCESMTLHHSSIEVYQRLTEDVEVYPKHTLAAQGWCEKKLPFALQTQIGEFLDNPSARRDGLAIVFSCEDCSGADMRLLISQHKGGTFVDWDVSNLRFTALPENPLVDAAMGVAILTE